MSTKLHQLLQGSGWQVVTDFEDEVYLFPDLQISVAGLEAASEGGATVAGSSASIETAPRAKAEFELLERIAILEAKKSLDFESFDYEKSQRQSISNVAVFPEAPNSDSHKYALSNGVALHSSWREACDNALYELVEREAVLSAWTFPMPVVLLGEALNSPQKRLNDSYEIFEVHFGTFDCEDHGKSIEVVGCFYFPKSDSNPLAMGLGASSTLTGALYKARHESLQTLAFLWGEEIPSFPAEPSPDAGFHQDFYLYPGHHGILKSWLTSRLQFGQVPQKRVVRVFALSS